MAEMEASPEIEPPVAEVASPTSPRRRASYSEQVTEETRRLSIGFKAGFQQGIKVIKKSGEKGKLQGEIMQLQGKIKDVKKAMGATIYDALLAGDQNLIDSVFGGYKAQVDELEGKITAKSTRMAEIDADV
mmetsp:Transcript_22246/g.68660  ORF Transcript_22246/g.68660 Transcript_22246/m.68660 type:complete len:131 (-) Transcript_22246:72-464(-)